MSETATATEQEKQGAIAVDLDNLDGNLVQEHIEIDPNANPMILSPVDDGKHRVKLSITEDGWKAKDTEGASPRAYLGCKIQGVVIAEGTKNHNKRVFKSVNTLVFDGKSELAYILAKALGDTPEVRAEVGRITNYVDLAKKFREVLAGEPIVQVTTKWSARYNSAPKDAKAKYVTALSGQRNFPQDGQGGYSPIVAVKGVGDVQALAEIQDYFADR